MPLNNLMRKSIPWSCGEDERRTFSQIREKLTATDTLAHSHYNPEIYVVLTTDASEYGGARVLHHKCNDGNEKVAYAIPITHEERASICADRKRGIWGMDKFSQFLYERKFRLLTDHQPACEYLAQKQGLPVVAVKRLHRWSLKLMLYSFDIENSKTAEFGNADRLSLLPDPRLKVVANYVQNGWPLKIKYQKLLSYREKQEALFVHNVCILW